MTDDAPDLTTSLAKDSVPEPQGVEEASASCSIFLVTATCNAGLVSWLDTSRWSEAGPGIGAAGIALAFVVGYALRGTASVTIPARPDREDRRERRLLAPRPAYS